MLHLQRVVRRRREASFVLWCVVVLRIKSMNISLLLNAYETHVSSKQKCTERLDNGFNLDLHVSLKWSRPSKSACR